jgi:hypothetical protein
MPYCAPIGIDVVVAPGVEAVAKKLPIPDRDVAVGATATPWALVVTTAV